MAVLLAVLLGAMLAYDNEPTAPAGPAAGMDSALAIVMVRLQQEEEFRSKPYPDSRGTTTIGWGTAIGQGITRTEAAYLLRERLEDTRKRLAKAWAPYEDMPAHVKEAVLDMAYQLGVEGTIEFTVMLAALERGDYAAARAAALDSEWARQTPERAERVAAGLMK